MGWYSNENIYIVLIRGLIALVIGLVLVAYFDSWSLISLVVAIGVPAILTVSNSSDHFKKKPKGRAEI